MGLFDFIPKEVTQAAQAVGGAVSGAGQAVINTGGQVAGAVVGTAGGAAEAVRSGGQAVIDAAAREAQAAREAAQQAAMRAAQELARQQAVREAADRANALAAEARRAAAAVNSAAVGTGTFVSKSLGIPSREDAPVTSVIQAGQNLIQQAQAPIVIASRVLESAPTAVADTIRAGREVANQATTLPQRIMEPVNAQGRTIITAVSLAPRVADNIITTQKASLGPVVEAGNRVIANVPVLGSFNKLGSAVTAPTPVKRTEDLLAAYRGSPVAAPIALAARAPEAVGNFNALVNRYNPLVVTAALNNAGEVVRRADGSIPVGTPKAPAQENRILPNLKDVLGVPKAVTGTISKQVFKPLGDTFGPGLKIMASTLDAPKADQRPTDLGKTSVETQKLTELYQKQQTLKSTLTSASPEQLALNKLYEKQLALKAQLESLPAAASQAEVDARTASWDALSSQIKAQESKVPAGSAAWDTLSSDIAKQEARVLRAQYWDTKSDENLRTGWLLSGMQEFGSALSRATQKMDKNVEATLTPLREQAIKMPTISVSNLPMVISSAITGDKKMSLAAETVAKTDRSSFNPWRSAVDTVDVFQKAGKVIMSDVPANIAYQGGLLPVAVEKSFKDPEAAAVVLASIPLMLWNMPGEQVKAAKDDPLRFAASNAGAMITMGSFEEAGRMTISPVARTVFRETLSPLGLVKRDIVTARPRVGDELGIEKGSAGSTIQDVLTKPVITELNSATQSSAIPVLKTKLGGTWEYFTTKLGTKNMPAGLKDTALGQAIQAKRTTYAVPSIEVAAKGKPAEVLRGAVSEHFVTKGETAGGLIGGEIHQFDNLQTVASELTPVEKATILADANKTGKGIDPKLYKKMLDLAEAKSDRIGEPVIALSPKRAFGHTYPELEMVLIYGKKLKARTVTSSQFVGYTESGVPIRKVRFGNQAPVETGLLGSLSKNREYNANWYDNYVKAAAEDMKVKSAQLKGKAYSLDWEHQTHGAQHSSAIEAEVLRQRAKSPALKKEVNPQQVAAAAYLHDIAKIGGGAETSALPHGQAAAEAIRRGHFVPDELKGLSAVQKEQVASAIEKHMTIEPWYSVKHPVKAAKTFLWDSPTGFETALASADRLAGRKEAKTIPQKVKGLIGNRDILGAEITSTNIVDPSRLWKAPEKRGVLTRVVTGTSDLISDILKTGPTLGGSPFMAGEFGPAPKAEIRAAAPGEVKAAFNSAVADAAKNLGIEYTPGMTLKEVIKASKEKATNSALATAAKEVGIPVPQAGTTIKQFVVNTREFVSTPEFGPAPKAEVKAAFNSAVADAAKNLGIEYTPGMTLKEVIKASKEKATNSALATAAKEAGVKQSTSIKEFLASVKEGAAASRGTTSNPIGKIEILEGTSWDTFSREISTAASEASKRGAARLEAEKARVKVKIKPKSNAEIEAQPVDQFLKDVRAGIDAMKPAQSPAKKVKILKTEAPSSSPKKLTEVAPPYKSEKYVPPAYRPKEKYVETPYKPGEKYVEPPYKPEKYIEPPYKPEKYVLPAYKPKEKYVEPPYVPKEKYVGPPYVPKEKYVEPPYKPEKYIPPAYKPKEKYVEPPYKPEKYVPPAYKPEKYIPPAYTPPGYKPTDYKPPGYKPTPYVPPIRPSRGSGSSPPADERRPRKSSERAQSYTETTAIATPEQMLLGMSSSAEEFIKAISPKMSKFAEPKASVFPSKSQTKPVAASKSQTRAKTASKQQNKPVAAPKPKISVKTASGKRSKK